MEENKPQQNYKDSKVLRTYTSDMADAIRTNEGSVIKIALAEKNRHDQEMLYKKAEGTKTSKILLFVGGIILITAAIFGSIILFQKKKAHDIPAPVINQVDTFITYDKQVLLDVTKATSISDLVGIIEKDTTKNYGLIKTIFLTRKTNAVDEMITTKDFFTLINSTAPGALTRALADKYLLGKYTNPNALSEKNKEATFLIFKVSDYNQAYASMLEWEKSMLKDLFVIFNIEIPGANPDFFNRTWKDIIINSRDARVLYGENGEGLLYYVFVNKDNFVITNSMDALKEVISRLIIKGV